MLIQEQPTKSKQMTLDEFLDWYPDGQGRFELHDGVVIEMQATGTQEQVGGYLAIELGVEIKRLALPYFIPRQGIIKAVDSDKSGYIADVMVLDWQRIETEPMWKKRATITKGETIRLVIEVVSTNWQDDYLMKLGEYEKLGIPEYWIVDYLGLGEDILATQNNARFPLTNWLTVSMSLISLEVMMWCDRLPSPI